MIAGSSPSNCTSTTAPITWVTRPLGAAFAAAAAAKPLAKVASGTMERLAMPFVCWPTNPENLIPERATGTAARSACLDKLPALREKRLMIAGTRFLEGCVATP